MSIFKNNIIEILDSTQSERDQLINHPLYLSIKEIKDLRIFMENHVFAVWDFMSILKELQKELTCVQTPWVPKGKSISSRLINEIVLDEETDIDPSGDYSSHFEIYLLGMAEAGANIKPINSFISGLIKGNSFDNQLKNNAIPEPAKEFVNATFSEIEEAPLHILASAFTFGREEVIPAMFSSIIKEINKKYNNNLRTFIYYLDRHIKLDSGYHGGMAFNMIKQICGSDKIKWMESIEISKKMLTARVRFWDEIYNMISK